MSIADINEESFINSIGDPAANYGVPSLIDQIGSFTGVTGAEAARRAGETQAGAITESARIAADQQQRGLDALMEQLGITRESFAPFLEAGTGALGGVQQGATAGGLDDILTQIMSGGGAFGSMIGERQRDLQGQLGAEGLTRSGIAMEESARVPTDLAFALESLLSGRQMGVMGMGLNAAGQSSGQGGFMSGQIANTFAGLGQTQAAGITGPARARTAGVLGGAQAQAQGMQNIGNMATSIFGRR